MAPASWAPQLQASRSNVASGLAFGWTGTNNGDHTRYGDQSFIHRQRHLGAGLDHRPTPTRSSPATKRSSPSMTARPRSSPCRPRRTSMANGRRRADTSQLGNGTFTVTMQEYLSDGTTIFGTGTSNVAPASAVLTLNVNLLQLALQATAAGDALAFAPHGDLPAGAGNWLHFDPLPGSHFTQGRPVAAVRHDGGRHPGRARWQRSAPASASLTPRLPAWVRC